MCLPDVTYACDPVTTHLTSIQSNIHPLLANVDCPNTRLDIDSCNTSYVCPTIQYVSSRVKGFNRMEIR